MHNIRICGCKGKKKNFIRQTFFVIQKNMLSLQRNKEIRRILSCDNQQNRNKKRTMATQETLDDIDIKILRLLQQNSHLTVKELAARVNLSPSPTFERQKRLEREGYIQRYGAIVDHHKMGHNVIVLCNIRLKQHTHDLIQQFMDTVQNIDQITECYNTTGDYDFQIKVYAHDMKDYQDFMLNTLGNIDCIGSLHSIIVIGEIKDSHYIPVNKYLRKK